MFPSRLMCPMCRLFTSVFSLLSLLEARNLSWMCLFVRWVFCQRSSPLFLCLNKKPRVKKEYMFVRKKDKTRERTDLDVFFLRKSSLSWMHRFNREECLLCGKVVLEGEHSVTQYNLWLMKHEWVSEEEKYLPLSIDINVVRELESGRRMQVEAEPRESFLWWEYSIFFFDLLRSWLF